MLGWLPNQALAFCGFFVSGADAELVNDATQVALMRSGNRTVMSMSNTYQGPPEDFAMVVPVPVVLKKDQVKTLAPDVFRAVDQISAPRLVEYWEQDPCRLQMESGLGFGAPGGGGLGMRGVGRGGGGFGVTVEAQFTAGEYEIVILSAKEANGLEGWLKANRYQIPAGASAALAPYVREGMKFFVAKVNIEKVIRDERGAVVLSPLRFDYEAPTLRLPVRLGLLNAKGKQDLVVYVLHPSSRFEVANYKNIFIPSNLEVENEVRERFGAFYTALFDATLAGAKGPAVVTEYAWQTTSCDPCPRAPLTPADLAALGGDLLNPGLARSRARLTQLSVKDDQATQVVKRVLRRRTNQISNCHERSARAQQKSKNAVSIEFVIGPDGRVAKSTQMGKNGGKLSDCVQKRVMRWRFPSPAKGESVTVKADWTFARSGSRSSGNFSTWVLTRLHTRYDAKTLDEDLVFVEASPVTGGRGFMGTNQEGLGSVEPAQVNNFQGRYIIRHYWEGEAACKSPMWDRWGARPGQTMGAGPGQKDKATTAKRRIERAAEPVPLAPFVRSSLPQLGLTGKGRPARKTKTP